MEANFVPIGYKTDYHNKETYCDKTMKLPHNVILVANCAPTDKTNCQNKGTFCVTIEYDLKMTNININWVASK